MDILHIANDFSGSKVYRQLIESLSVYNIRQIVYTAIRDKSLVGANYPSDSKSKIDVCYSPILNIYTRIDFFEKRRRIYNDLITNISISDIDIVHAHTWYSDGSIALRLFEEYQIPYVVSIRSTDVDLYHPYMLHLRRLGEKVLKNARKIIFISEAHKRKLVRKYENTPMGELLQMKSVVIPNGIDSYWLKNMYDKKLVVSSPFRLVYVGTFIPRKNVPRLMKAIIELNKNEKEQFSLTLVGGGGRDTSKIKSIIKKYPNYFTYLGRENKEVLCQIYRDHEAFVMPSWTETFGLVYVEAMSQGLPVLYSKGEGIDGFFSSSYGVKCEPKSLNSIKEGIRLLQDNYGDFKLESTYIKTKFNWDSIADHYLHEIYRF